MVGGKRRGEFDDLTIADPTLQFWDGTGAVPYTSRSGLANKNTIGLERWADLRYTAPHRFDRLGAHDHVS